MATGGYEVTAETSNFNRMCLVVVDVFRDILWETLTKEISPVDLSKKVQTFNKGKLKLKDEQYTKICKPGGGIPTVKDCDVSTLYKILRNICPKFQRAKNKPTCGDWGDYDRFPDPNNCRRLADDIERIRFLRNDFFGHASDGKICNDVFMDFWKKAEHIAECFDRRFYHGKVHFQEQLNDIELNCMDEKTRSEYLEEIKKQQTYDEETRQMVEVLSDKHDRDIDDVRRKQKSMEMEHENLEKEFKKSKKEVNPALKNMLDDTKVELKELEETVGFVETKPFKRAKASLSTKRVVFLSGNPGEGKTTMASFLLIDSDHRNKCLIVKQPEDFNHIGKDDVPEHVSMIMIDNIFGVKQFDVHSYEMWKKKFRKMVELKNKKVFFIFTNREYIMKQFKKIMKEISSEEGDNERKAECELFKGIDYEVLSSDKLGRSEKKQILLNHLEKAGRKLPEKMVLECVDNFKPHFAFPLCCRMFASTDINFRMGVKFFSRPLKALQEGMKEFRGVDTSLIANFVALATVWLKGKTHQSGYSSAVNRRFIYLEHSNSLALHECTIDEITDVAKKCGLNIGNFSKEDLFEHLEGIYLTCIGLEKEKFYTFAHERLYDAFGQLLFQKAPEIALEKAGVAFLVENTTTKAQIEKDKAKGNVPLKVQLERDVYEALSEKLTQTLRKGSSDFIALHHDAFNDTDFLDVWFKHIFREDLFEELLKHDTDTFYFRPSSSLLTEAIDQDNPKEEMVRRIFKSEKLLSMRKEWVQTQKNKCLELACKRGCEALFQELLNSGAQLSQVTLLLSVGAGDIRLVERHFQSYSTELEKKPKHVINNCLQVAASKAHLDLVKKFIEFGADIEDTKSTGETPLCSAIQCKLEDVKEDKQKKLEEIEDVVVFLIDKGANINVTTGKKVKNTCLHLACQYGFLKVAKALVAKGVDINKNNSNDTAPLHFALMFRNEDVAVYLLDEGANVTQVGGRLDKTPLHFAAEEGLLLATKKILEKGGKVESTDKKGHSAMHYAAMNGYEGVIQELAKYGNKHKTLRAFCHLKKSEIKGFAAIHYAARRNHPKAVEALMDIPEVNPEVKDSYGRTPLYLAARFGHHEPVEVLLTRSSPNDQEKKLGFTALHIAVDRGHAKVVEVLCQNERVICSQPDKKGLTPLHIASKKGDRLIVSLLLGGDADTRMPDKEGNVPLHLCRNAKVAELLCQKDRTAVHIKNNQDVTPLEGARDAGVIEVLEKYKDEPMEVDEPLGVDG